MSITFSPEAPFDPNAEALAFHAATYARINNWPAGAETVFRFGDKSRVETVPVGDAHAFADVVARNHGRPEVFATVNPRLAGSVAAGGFQTGTADHTAPTQMLMADLDVGKEGYPASIGEAIAMAETFALAPHAMYTSGKGLQVIFLLESPLVSTEEKLLVGRMQAALQDHAASMGFSVDRGIMTNPTRLLRVPGSLNHKKEYDRPLEARMISSHPDLPLYPLAAVAVAAPEDRTATERYSDLSQPGTQMARSLPITRILAEAHGWTPGDRGSWNSNLAGSSSPKSASLYAPNPDLEAVTIWSGSTAREYGVDSRRPYTSFDWLAAVLCGGNYNLATRLASQAVEAASFEPLLNLFARDLKPSFGELQDMARQASPAWPVGAERQHTSALAFRGVAADVASARGYESTQLQAHLAAWVGPKGEALRALGGGGMKVNLHFNKVPRTGVSNFTVRPDAHAKFVIDNKNQDPCPVPRTGMPPFTQNTWDGCNLDTNPLGKDALADVDAPLIVLAMETPFSYGQIHGDALVTAARREGLDVAVVNAASFTATMELAGSTYNSTHTNRLGAAWAGIKLRGREVFLGGRASWRRAAGLVALGDVLVAKGATVRVLDFEAGTPAFSTDRSEMSVADFVARGKAGALEALMESALDLQDAAAQAVDYAATELGAARRVASEFYRMGSYRVNTLRRTWMRNEGAAWVNGADPLAEAAKILERDGVAEFKIAELKRIVEFAKADPVLGYDPVLDQAAEDDLNCLNGVIDLRTGTLRERRIGEVHEHVARACYNPNALAPQWQEFLDTVLPDRETQRFVQKVFGAGVRNSAAVELVTYLTGSGANGKSVLVRAITNLVGDMSASLDPAVMEGTIAEHQWAYLLGRRLLVLAELAKGRAWSSALLKQIATVDERPAAFKYGDAFSFTPTFSPFVMTNYKPFIKETDNGTWRRIRIVEFGVQIPEERQDKMLQGKLATENEGILRWLVEGAMAFHSEGLKSPAAVELATNGYKASMDEIQQFLDAGRVHLDPAGRMKRSDVYNEYRSWHEDSIGTKAWAVKTFSAEFHDRFGVEVKRIKGEHHYTGLRLGPSPAQVQAELDATEIPNSTEALDTLVATNQAAAAATIQADIDARTEF